MLTITFNHSAKTLSESIGLSTEDLLYVKLLIIFNSMNSKLLIDKLFDKEEDAPEDMKTTSGNIEKLLPLMKNDAMTLFTLMHYEAISNEILVGYDILKHPDKMKEIISVEEDSVEKSFKELALQLRLAPIKSIIKHINDSHGDFNKFYDVVKSKISMLISDEKLNLFDQDDN